MIWWRLIPAVVLLALGVPPAQAQESVPFKSEEGTPRGLLQRPKIDEQVRSKAESSPVVSVFVVLRRQPQKEIFQRHHQAAALRRMILEARLRRAAERLFPSPEAERARADLEEAEVEVRRAAFREIEAEVEPELETAETKLVGLGAQNLRRYVGITMLSADLPSSALAALEADPDVAQVVLVERHRALLVNSVPSLGADTFWRNGFTGQGEAVAVFDTGVRTNHPAFAGKNVVSQVFLSSAARDSCFDDDPASAEDLYGHGTHVAGIVASQGSIGWQDYLGVAKGISTLYNLKVAFRVKAVSGCDGPSASALSSDVAAGLDWLVRNTPVKVVNYSFGAETAQDDTASSRIWDQYADNYGLSASVAAGNSGSTANAVSSPGIAYNVLSVANWSSRGTIWPSSSRGPTAGGRYKPDLAAPGRNIVSAAYDWDGGVNGSNPDFVTKTGTSMAAPHIAGALALIRSAGVRDPLAAKALLLNTTDNTGWQADRGWGFTNLDNAWSQRSFYTTGALSAAGTPGGRRLYRITATGPLRATVTWNRHVSGSASFFNNVDLYLYEGASGAVISSSETAVQNVEQVSATTGGEAVLKVSMASASLQGGIAAEPFGLALSTSSWAEAAGPRLSGSCSFPSSVGSGQAFQVHCTVTNDGDLRAFNVTGQFSLPAGFGGSTLNFGNLAPGASSGPVSGVIVAGAAGTYSLELNVSSSSYGETFRASVSGSLTVTSLPGGPSIGITGLGGAVNAAEQRPFNVELSAPYAVDVQGTVTLAFTPDAARPVDDPAIQFSAGGRTLAFAIPAGATRAFSTPPSLQTGTVAGTIRLTLAISAGGVDITPSPAPSAEIRIARSAPVIQTIQLMKSSQGFEVRITGYSTPRQMTQAVFQFGASAQGRLETISLTVPLDAAFGSWYSGAASTPFGSLFLYTQPFTVQGDASAIGSVTVRLVNEAGSSAPASVPF